MDLIAAFASHRISLSSSVEADATLGCGAPSVLCDEAWCQGTVSVILIISSWRFRGSAIDFKNVAGYKFRSLKNSSPG